MNIFVLGIGVFLFVLGLWQLDHFVAPFIWRHKGEMIEIFTFPGVGDVALEVTQFYALCFGCIVAAFFLIFAWFAV